MCPAITGELVFALQRVYTEAPRTSLFVSKMFLVLALVFFWYSIGTGTGCVGEVQEPDMAAARSFTGCVLPSTIHGARATTGEQILPLIFSISMVL